ncbi:MAG: alkaline phosphatase [Spirochaetales bacterium]|nr:alkaline phosphatase [Spirochaetales bacterium]
MKNFRKNKTFIIFILTIFLSITSGPLFAGGNVDKTDEKIQSSQNIEAKYVFLFIGDGMSMAQVNSAEIFANSLSNQDIQIQKLNFTRFPVSGLTTTYDASSFITDSASSATAMASGNKTLSGVINMDTTKTVPFKLITEYASDKGKKIGIISTVSLDHATPAAFYAKAASRSDYYGIAKQIVNSGFDYFAGGGFAQPKGKEKDQTDIITILTDAGYTYVNSRENFDALKSGDEKIIAVNSFLQDSAAMPYDIDRSPDDLSLADYTRKGIELLSKDPEGFFMMVESGKIDWACHANDAGASIRDLIAFDQAISEALAFAKQHPMETLIVVTGDHETGGMTIGFAGTKYTTSFNNIKAQKMSFTAFNTKILGPYKAATPKNKAKLADLLPGLKDAFGLDFESLTAFQKEQLELAFQRSMGNEMVRAVEEDQYLLYGGYEPFTVKITQLANQNAGIGWTSYSHTGVPVATFAMGAGEELFAGYYDNTEIFQKLADAMNISTAN